MSTSQMFQDFLNNIKIDNGAQISLRYEEITASLNKTFRDTESKSDNSVQVGSYGRWSAIKGVSDLDMLYLMPKSAWDTYKDGKQSKLLTDTKDGIQARYPSTKIKVDRLVVRVLYRNFHVEVQPVFEQDDGSFKYPDTYNGSSWKITKPREEMAAMTEFGKQKNRNLRRLCKMARAWKNKHGVAMGGLLIDTLAYNFLKSTNDYDDKTYGSYDSMCRDFFLYLAELPNQDYFAALGSGQRVKVKAKFQKKARKAYDLSLKAIEAAGTKSANEKWKKVFGRPFPANAQAETEAALAKSLNSWRDTEEFIEVMFPVDIRSNIRIDCEVKQAGFRPSLLRTLLESKMKLRAKKDLTFYVVSTDVQGDYQLYWKVLNRGREAERRDMIRGQIALDDGHLKRSENTSFEGEHVVECYAVQDGVVVATDRIHVPISGETSE